MTKNEDFRKSLKTHVENLVIMSDVVADFGRLKSSDTKVDLEKVLVASLKSESLTDFLKEEIKTSSACSSGEEEVVGLIFEKLVICEDVAGI